jgi:hypothetical protein
MDQINLIKRKRLNELIKEVQCINDINFKEWFEFTAKKREGIKDQLTEYEYKYLLGNPGENRYFALWLKLPIPAENSEIINFVSRAKILIDRRIEHPIIEVKSFSHSIEEHEKTGISDIGGFQQLLLIPVEYNTVGDWSDIEW